MKKFLLTLTLFFTVESWAGNSPITEEDEEKFLTTFVVVGGIAFLVAASSQYSSDYGSVDYMYFDEQNNSIIFTEDSGLENFEILLSRDAKINFSNNNYFDDNLFKSDELYVGIKYRF